jgi:CHAT domain-containing protein/predicted negative regulator of RcsB-dependent stress response
MPKPHRLAVIGLAAFVLLNLILLSGQTSRAQAPGVGTLAFVVNDGQKHSLYRIDTDGGNFKALGYQVDSGAVAPIAWSPDGQQLAFVDSTTHKFTIVDSDGGQPRTFSIPIASWAFAWAPDGQHIAYVNGNGNAVENFDLATGKSTAIATIQPSTNSKNLVYIIAIGWSPDGKHLFFIAEPVNTDELHVVNVDDGTEQIVAIGGMHAATWSADSQHIIYSGSNNGRNGVLSLDLNSKTNGQNTVNLVTSIGGIGLAFDSASDNKQFAYSGGNGVNQLFVLDANGLKIHRVSLPSVITASRFEINGIAWRPGTGLGGMPAALADTPPAPTAAATAAVGGSSPTPASSPTPVLSPTPGGTKDQILAAIKSALISADKAFNAAYSDQVSWQNTLDTALLNYTTAISLITGNKDLPDFGQEPDRTTFQTFEYRALAGKARTEARKLSPLSSANSAPGTLSGFYNISPSQNSLMEVQTAPIRADIQAAIDFGQALTKPPADLGWLYLTLGQVLVPNNAYWGLRYNVPVTSFEALPQLIITDISEVGAYTAYTANGSAATLFKAQNRLDLYKDLVAIQANLARDFILGAAEDSVRTYQGLSGIQWWKQSIRLYQSINDPNYCDMALNYSQAIEDGAIVDPDKESLRYWLKEQINSFCSRNYIAIAQARLAWLNGDLALAHQVLLNPGDTVGNSYYPTTEQYFQTEALAKANLMAGNSLQALTELKAAEPRFAQAESVYSSRYGMRYNLSVNDASARYKDLPSTNQFHYENEWLIGRALVQLGRYRDGLTQLQTLEKMVPDYAKNVVYPGAQYDLGRAYIGLNRYDTAIVPLETSVKAYQDQLTTAVTAKDADLTRTARVGLIEATLTLSTPLAVLGRTEEAVTTLQQALDEATKQDDPVLKVNTTLRVGDIYLQLQKEDDALRNYQAAVDLALTAKLPQQQGRALLGVGQILTKRGKIDDARKAITQANVAAKAANDSSSQVQALDALGDLALLGKPDAKAAQTFYGQALTIAIASKDPRLPIQPLTSLGDVQTSSTPSTAQFTYYRALSAAQQIDDREAQARLFARIGALAAVQGDTFNADSAYQNAIQVIEQTQRGFKSETLTGQFAANYAPVYASYLKLLVDQKRYADAFALSEQARARAFLDQLAVGPVDYRQGASADLLQQTNDLRTQIDALRQLQIQTEADTETAPDAHKLALSQVQNSLQEAERKYSDIFTRLQASAPQLSSLTSVQTLPLAQVQATLASDTTLISYYTLDSTTYAFVITHDALTVVTLPVGQAQLRQSVKLFRADEKQVQGLSDLSSAILTPVMNQLKTARVIVVPHNVLNYIPFAALPTAATAGSPLFGVQFVVSYLPSASSLAYLSKTPDQPGVLFAMGNPAADGQPPLQFAEAEVKQAVAIAGGEAFTGKDATVALLQQKAGDAGTLYIAAHGTFNGLNPLFSALHLTTTSDDSGLLEAYKIYSLDLTHNTQLVVLSACDTAVGTLSAGDEFTGLNRAFLYAGAPAVIATLWSVDDKATGLLMKTFFEMRAKGQPIAQSLQSAQAFMQTYQENGQTPYASPYYWAAFIITGATKS